MGGSLTYKSACEVEGIMVAPRYQEQVERVLALYDDVNIHGVSDGKIQTAVFDVIPTEPGFEPHDIVRTEKGVTGSYFWLWEHFFDTNLWHATIVEVMRDFLIGQGFALSNTTPEQVKRWETWKRESQFDEVMGVLLIDLFRVGNLAANLFRETSNVMDLRLQPIPVRGLQPVFDEAQTSIVGWNYIPPDHRNSFDPWNSQGMRSSHLQPQPIDPEDLLHVAINKVPGVVFGRAVNYQAFGEYAGLKDLHRVAGVLAARQTSRFILWSVDTEGLSPQHIDDDTDATKRKDSPALQMMKAVRAAVQNRVRINQETGETRIVDNVILDKRVTGTDLTGQPELAGLAETINTFKASVNMKARIPPVFLATPDDSNRATSYNELIVFVLMMKSFFRPIASELERVVLPELNLQGEIVPQEEIIQEDDAVKSEMIETLLSAWERGVLSREEVREQLERLLTIGISPDMPNEADDFPEPKPETEEAEA